MLLPKEITLTITNVTVYMTDGLDRIKLSTTLPCPFPKEVESGQLPVDIYIMTPFKQGVDYCKENFGIVPEVIDLA